MNASPGFYLLLQIQEAHFMSLIRIAMTFRITMDQPNMFPSSSVFAVALLTQNVRIGDIYFRYFRAWLLFLARGVPG